MNTLAIIMNKSFYFISIIPSKEVFKQIKHYQKIMATQFNSPKSFGHIPHLTLIPPFHIDSALESQLKTLLTTFSRNLEPFPIQIKGFSYFKKHTIFAEIKKTESLEKLHFELLKLLNNEPDLLTKPIQYFQKYNPHITIGYKDLKPNFKTAWEFFETETISHSFIFEKIDLLKHNGEKWGKISFIQN